MSGEAAVLVDAFVLDDLCPRCGASMQGTHHPLCQERDGTPTLLSDEVVRYCLERLREARDG